MEHFLKKYINNKYFYTGFVFLVWLFFFDQENLMVQHDLSSDLNDLRDQKAFYLEETEENKGIIERLESDSLELETLAREKYYMKRDNEDIFVVVREEE